MRGGPFAGFVVATDSLVFDRDPAGAASVEAGGRPRGEASRHRPAILFVADDSDARFRYHAAARARGFGVELAREAGEAFTLANVLEPAVIVIDMRVGRLDGIELAARLRKSERTRTIPIVLVTGETSETLDAAIWQSGCEGHLVDPCPVDVLLRMVAILAIRRRIPADVALDGARGVGE